MIFKDEIELKSKEFAINTSDIQRDYLFGWMLYYFFTKSFVREDIFLKGGNALRKAYFINTRFSSDLDFGISNDIEIDVLKRGIYEACQYINQNSGIEFIYERNDVQEKFGKWKEDRWKVFDASIYFKDFYGNASKMVLKISLDITRFDKLYLPPQECNLIHPYSDADIIACKIRVAQLEEILAVKLKCLLQREHAEDLFDLIFSIYLNSEISINKEKVREIFLKRTIFESSPNVAKDILLKLPFTYLKATWAKSIICAQDVYFEAEDALSKFISSINDIFSDISETSYNEHYFFTAEARNKLMKAGREMTLLRVVYNGFERLVEPYALKFQERADGIAKEYFYVYDRVGSKNNPDWKRFIAENLQGIENTEEKFIPQFEIELYKAGELPNDPYLYNRATHATYKKSKSFSHSYRYGPTYIFKCSNCGKLFYRKKQNNSLGEHKSKQGGYRCFGYGVYVEMRSS
jgi:predicted nucleotidyltransferase component of viral defense system